MMRYLFAVMALILVPVSTASAEPVLKVINFTADWCPNCQILNPRLDEAIEAFDEGSIERVDLDVTRMRRGASPIERADVQTQMLKLAGTHQAAYLWDWYGGVTGIAVAIAADNGEPITCFMRPMKADEIKDRLNLARILAENGKPGTRKPNGPDCPVLK
jgi:thiol-disulfide isomerase/thioredoxin